MPTNGPQHDLRSDGHLNHIFSQNRLEAYDLEQMVKGRFIIDKSDVVNLY